eukprot:1150143-Pelagomonas_calceolata.AAC.5
MVLMVAGTHHGTHHISQHSSCWPALVMVGIHHDGTLDGWHTCASVAPTWMQLPPAAVDTEILHDATRREARST